MTVPTSFPQEDRGSSRLAPTLLSLLQPGVGQFLNRQSRKGIVMIVAGLAAALLIGNAARSLSLFLAFAGLSLSVRAWSAIDAFFFAPSRAARAGAWFTRWWACLGLLVALSIVTIGLGRFATHGVFEIASGSMEPTLQVGDHVMSLTVDPDTFEPARGQILVIADPEDPEVSLIVRCVAVGGETVEIRDKRLYIDGEAVDEPYVVHTDSRTFPRGGRSGPEVGRRDQLEATTIPKGYLFCLGDNRDASYDSRFWGPVHEVTVRGRPLFIYWGKDLSRIGHSF